jgi:hypothetical protein
MIGALVDAPATMVNAVGDTVASMLTRGTLEGKKWMEKVVVSRPRERPHFRSATAPANSFKTGIEVFRITRRMAMYGKRKAMKANSFTKAIP